MQPRTTHSYHNALPRALITGATSGIGRATAIALAVSGWHVTISGRDESALNDTQDTANTAAGTEACNTLRLDLADLDATREAAVAIRSKGQPLDLLVCNAGIMAPPTRRSGPDGHELQLTINHLAHYILASKLLPLLRLSGTGRMVWVSSIRHHAAPSDEREPWNPMWYDGRASYATSKAWNLAMSLWLDNRLTTDPSGVRSVAAHPGWSRTALQSRAPLWDGGTPRARLQAKMTALLAQSAKAGALPILAAATRPLTNQPTYLGPSGPLELWGGRAAAAKLSQLAANERWQSWVASKSAELTRTALPA